MSTEATSSIGDGVLIINTRLQVPLSEIEMDAVRAQGAGGQHVNKTSSAIHLRFDIAASSLPDDCKEALGRQRDQRISSDGTIVIKSQQFRSQPQNREAALERLAVLIRRALHQPKMRRPTRISKSAKKRRTDSKTQRGHVKKLRTRVDDHS